MIGLLHPGQMGTAVGAALTAVGHRVGWASDGRSNATAQRASQAGFTDLGSIEQVTRQCDVILSVCPPQAALETATRVDGFAGLYVDANAVSPGTARRISDVMHASGADYVDGGIIGVPPKTPGQTRIYLSGERADDVRALFAGSLFEAVTIDADPTRASALKMCYAAWTKISAGLLLAVADTAGKLEVDEFLAREWQLSQPALADRLLNARASAETKGWRWVAEMEEVAATFSEAGAPVGFGEAAAAVYRRYDRPS